MRFYPTAISRWAFQRLLAVFFRFGKLVKGDSTKLINLQTVLVRKNKHGLPNHRLGNFIAAR